MKRHLITMVLACVSLSETYAQADGKTSVIIGSFIEKPNAVLALNPPKRNQGFLVPQLSSQERLSIRPASPSDDGLIVYDVTEKAFFYWKDNKWVKGLGAEMLNQTVTFDERSQTLHLTDGGVADLSSLKEVPSPAGQSGKLLTTDGSSLFWKDMVLSEDQSLTFNPSTRELSISESSSSIDLSSLADLDKTSKTGVLIGNAGIIHGVNGAVAGHVLKWNGTTWIADSEASVVSDNVSVQGDGSSVNPIAIKAQAVTAVHIADNSVNANKIAEDAVGVSELANGAVDTNALQDGSVTTQKLAPSSVNVVHFISGGLNKILATDGMGTVSWADKTIFTDNQGLLLKDNTLNIDRGVGADLNSLTTGGGVISGSLNNLTIVDGAITSADLANGVVTPQKVASGGANKVLSTDVVGNVIWADQVALQVDRSITNETITALELSSNQLKISEGTVVQTVDLNSLALSGDIAGTIKSNVVTKIQGQEVQAGTPADGKILKWSGGKWVFADDETGSISIASMTKVNNLDVTEFRETNDQANETEHAIYRIYGPTSTFGYMGKRDKIRDIVAGLHIPHGGELKLITSFLWDNETSGRDIEVELIQKSLATGSLVQIGLAKTTGASPSIQQVSIPVSLPIDNSKYIYFIRIHWDLGPNDYVADKLSLINQRLYGVSYEFTEPGNVISGPGTSQTIYVNTAAPATPYTGQVWLDTTSQHLKYWSGTGWIQHQ